MRNADIEKELIHQQTQRSESEKDAIIFELQSKLREQVNTINEQ